MALEEIDINAESISATTLSADTMYIGGNSLSPTNAFFPTLSANTYFGLPPEVIITGGTYSNGDFIFNNNTGGTFTVTGSSTYSAGSISGFPNWINPSNGTIILPTVQVALYNNSAFTEPIRIYTVMSGTSGSGGIPSLVDETINYVYIDYNNGSPIYNISTDNSNINDSNIVRFLNIYRSGNFIHIIEFGDQGAGLPNKLNNRMLATQRFARESGLSLGLSASTGIITLSNGVTWDGSYREPLDAVNSQNNTFFKNFHSGGTWVHITSAHTLNNTYYDNGTNIVSATTNYYLTNWYYRGQEDAKHLYEVYSTNQYDSVSNAELATEPGAPELISSHAILVGRIVVQAGSLTGIVQSSFVSVFQASNIISHNDTTGKQGGVTGGYFHLSPNQYSNITLTNTDNIFAGNQMFNVLSATTIYSGGTNLENVINSIASQISLSSATFTGAVVASSLSATTISGGTLYSGSTELSTLFATPTNISLINSQLNTKSNLSGATFTGAVVAQSLSATAISGGTLFSGSTNLYSIFSTLGGSQTLVQPGSNITTGGTSNLPIVNLVTSPSINSITASGASSFTTLTATTFISGSTNLNVYFNQDRAQIATKANLSGATFTDGVIASSFSATTISGGTLFSGTTDLNIYFNQDRAQINTKVNRSGDTFTGDVFIPNLSATTISATTISGDTIFLEETATPANPISGVTIYAENYANRRMLAQNGPSGVDYVFQPTLARNKVAWWNPAGNSTTVPGVLGMAALTATGTATSRNVATTNMFTRTKRLALVSATTAGSLAGYRLAALQYSIGNGSGLGGFMYVIRFGVGDAQSATRMFIGLKSVTSSPSNVEPSTLTKIIGIGNGAANTNLFLYYGGSAAQTPINLGANFPTNTNSVDFYELALFASPSSDNSVGYRVKRLNTGDVATGILTGVAGKALPSSTTRLCQNDFRTNNASTGAVSLEYVSIYIETDN